MEKGLDKDQKLLIIKHGQKTGIGYSKVGNVTNLKTNKTLFIPCDCGSEILMIEYDHEIKIADLAMYETSLSHKYKMSLWQRLRYCYQVLIKKKPYSDQITLNNKQLLDLKAFLNTLDLK
jgi:hypothetical protein